MNHSNAILVNINDKYGKYANNAISEITEKSYDSHVTAMTRYSIERRTLEWESPALISFTNLIDDLLMRKDLSTGTKRTYRAALMWFMAGYPGKTPGDLQSLARLEESALPKGRRTDSSKPKVISEEDYRKLVTEIEVQGHE